MDTQFNTQVDTKFETIIECIKNSDKSSITSTADANSEIETNTNILDLTAGGSVQALTKKIKKYNPLSIRNKGINYCEFLQAFPSGTDTYYINIYPINSTTLGSKIPTTYPNYTINQYANPTLTITAVEGTGTGYSVTTTGRVDYIGRPNAYSEDLVGKEIKEMFNLTIVATRSSTNTFSAVANPIWSSSSATTSHWDNSVPADNGGTKIIITNITQTDTSTAGADTYYLKFDVIVVKWGTSDVTMNVNLDDMVETYAS